MNQDRNLLFGVFAVQLRKVSPSELMQAAGAWAADSSQDLSHHLHQAGALSEKDANLIQRLVDEAVNAHDGDAHATLLAFGGPEEIQQTFHGSIQITPEVGVTKPKPIEAAITDPEQLGVEEAPGRYSRESEHATGGMGRVLLVHDEFLGRDIALKELLPTGDESGEPWAENPVRSTAPLLARFLQEARFTGQLEHPAIIPVYELGRRKNGTLYYTMKLVRGRSLAEAIQASQGLRDRLELLPHFVDLCQAIAYAHSRGVIHRDIKPANVMVGEFGETVVIDWGLAKAQGREDVHADGIQETLNLLTRGQTSDAAKTAYGHAFGTPAYMPPEQARGQLDHVDERSDVYSLGVVLYEILTGRVPFGDTSVEETLERVTRDEPHPIIAIEPDTPPELIAICERAMVKDPAKRYASAKELAQDVERFQAGAMVQVYQYRFSEHLRRFIKRHRPVLATAAAALIALLGFGVFSYVNVLQARNQEREARRDAELAYAQADSERQAAETARARARDEADAANEVVDFLVGLFEVSHPDEAQGRTITAREILDQGVRDIENKLSDRPIVKAKLSHTMGAVYMMLGLFDQAEPLLSDALALRTEHLGSNHPDVAETLHRLAWMHQLAGDYTAAESNYEAAMAVCATLDDDACRAQSLGGLGSTLVYAGRYDEAEKALRESLALRLDHHGENSLEVAESYLDLGYALWIQNKLTEAMEILEKAVAIHRNSDHYWTRNAGGAIGTLGLVNSRAGNFDKAEALLLEADTIFARVYGPDHHERGTVLNNLSVLEYRQRDYDAAEDYIREVIRIKRNAFGDDHYDVGQALHNLASILEVMDRDEEAERLFLESQDIWKRVLEPDHPELAISYHQLGSLYYKLKRYEEAEEHARQALEIRRANFAADSPEVRQSLLLLRRALNAQDKTEEADAIREEISRM